MDIKDCITKRQYKRTIKLLRNTRSKYGIDMYLLMKKILALPMLSDYYQDKYHTLTSWIKYESVLRRNEELIDEESSVEYIINKNGLKPLGGYMYFGIDKETVLHDRLSNVITKAHNYWLGKIIGEKKNG